MKTEKLKGTEKRLYELVGPIVMNPTAIRQNDNAAFKTSEKHVWYIALDENDICIGFLPVQNKKTIAEINNYFIFGRDPEVMKVLLRFAEKDCKKEKFETLAIITQMNEYPIAKKLKFTAVKAWTKFTRFEKKL